ncbi:ABC transporter, ATP-binding domain protein [Mycobacterium xenopi 3993]|nr:ABC transporter, ATP-binding domain protein [Mycobacterium xenopi 3993]
MRITDRDGLAVANVDYRHPHAVDVDAVSALVDCHPLFAGEPQYEVHRRDPPATTVVEAEIRPAVVTDRDVAAGRNVWLVDPTHTVNGEANASVRMAATFHHPSGPIDGCLPVATIIYRIAPRSRRQRAATG